MDAIVTPPYRTALLTENGVPLLRVNDQSSGDNRITIQTTRDWWIYWNNLGSQVNINAKLVTQGTHADRPVATGMPDGAIYVESDRGAIYQNQNGVWQYLAGTMFGTLVPDERPADLGINDAGFDFRSVDTDPYYTAREFLWSQTEWIETTPVLYGTHAARPSGASAPSRCLYVETDRGNVLYQNQNGTWKYLAGTMFGTLSPDQRPTDLGVNDGGFDFRTSVPPPREFIWSQTTWVETTPVTGALNLTHPNVVAKVGAVGEIVEGGITDESAANSDRMHIKATGEVGFGTGNPAFQTHVFGAGQNGSVYNPVAGPMGGALCLQDSTAAGGSGGVVMFGANFAAPFTAIKGVATNGADYSQGDLVFYIRELSSEAWLREFLRITAAGNIVITTLRGTNPGAGSRQLWYDPADGNRVKFAP